MKYHELNEKGLLPAQPLATVKGPVDGNVFAIIGAVRRALSRAGFRKEAADVTEQMTSSSSYDDALAIASAYVDFDI